MLSVRCGGQDAGAATPHHITRHAHPKARPETRPGDDAPRATGIDYLSLIGERHHRQAAGPVNYAALINPASGDAAAASAGQQEEGEEDPRG